MTQFYKSYRDSAPSLPPSHLTSFKTRAAWEVSPGPLLKRHPGASRLLVELTSLWEIPAAASKLGLAPVTQPAFPRLIPLFKILSWWQPLPGLLCLGFCSSNLPGLLGHVGQPGSAALGSIPVSPASRAPMRLVSERSSATPVILKAWPAPSA